MNARHYSYTLLHTIIVALLIPTGCGGDGMNATQPSVVITDSIAGTAITTSQITYTFTFSENVTGFTTDDIVVTGGAKGTFASTSASVYTLIVATPVDSTTDITVDVAADVAINAGSNGNTAATQSVQTVNTDDGGNDLPGFKAVSQVDWSETSVRKVLHAFAYGGLTTDNQIKAWAAMPPEDAILEILTFTYSNEKLSLSEDASSTHGASLKNLQNFWGGNAVDNPMHWKKRKVYTTLATDVNGTTTGVASEYTQNTWIQAVNTRGLNPFLHKVGFFLTNYHMSLKAEKASPGLLRDYYDQMLADLVSGIPFSEVIANASKSAAVAKNYGHSYNWYKNAHGIFIGNDDFAREYFQLFFRYLGEDDYDYHEEVNIENNAKLLTGMLLDKQYMAYGSRLPPDWWIAPIQFTNHHDASDRYLENQSRHHADCLEIMHQEICGVNAGIKIKTLSPIVSSNPEVLNNLPVFIIGHFADDRLTQSKITTIREAWRIANDNLLDFLCAYAISTTFHSSDTVKFRTTFNRNLTLYNTIVLDNKEAFVGRDVVDTPRMEMLQQGGEVFQPIHDVFGGQTGVEAAESPGLFRSAFIAALYTESRLARTNLIYDTDETGTTQASWEKDWGSLIQPNSSSQYVAGEIADWLWERIVADGGKNFDIIARSQVLSLLARGYDFGYAVTVIDPAISNDPEATYSSLQLENNPELIAIINTLASETLALNSSDITGARRTANQRVNYAANFISALPYTFALEGK